MNDQSKKNHHAESAGSAKRRLRLSYGLRAFAIYFITLGSLSWFTLDNAIERLNGGMRQAAENVMVDSVNILAAFIEDEVGGAQALQTAELARVFEMVEQRSFLAKIYRVTKTSVSSQVYVTDELGVIVYDSRNVSVGQDFSEWRDVRRTLDGSYGARTSWLPSTSRRFSEQKAMIVAAPIKVAEKTIGVVSILTPIDSLEEHLLTETTQLQNYVFVLLAVALLLGFLLSMWFTRSLGKIANYANKMASGQHVEMPRLLDQRLADLAQSVSNLRNQLDGKEYVEDYIHSLTHELKTPITGIQGAVELLNEDMPATDKARFLSNISNSNQRMARLVERMLSLAKLEGQSELVKKEEFDAVAMIKRLLEERNQVITMRKIELQLRPESDETQTLNWLGDRVLLSQAVANLLDNALAFCTQGGTLSIDVGTNSVTICNQGEAIPEYALPKIYDRFFSLPRSAGQAQQIGDQPAQMGKSTGLGLSFVKEIMKLHKGTINVCNHADGVKAELRW